MKKRPSFKVAAIESLEGRELLSTASVTANAISFRPQSLRASYLTSNGIEQADSAKSLHVQGAPTKTFSGTALTSARLALAKANHNALLSAALARRTQRLTGFAVPAALTTSAASSTPTKLAPDLPFTPKTLTGTASGFTRTTNVASSRTSTPISLSSSSPSFSTPGSTTATANSMIVPLTSADIAAIKASAAANAATTTGSTTTATTTPTVLSTDSVKALRVAVDNFAGYYTSGANAPSDTATLAALKSGLAAIGGSAWPTATTVSQSAVDNLQAQVNAFVKGYTGGTDVNADSTAWSNLQTGLAGFATMTPAIATVTGTAAGNTGSASTTSAVNTAAVAIPTTATTTATTVTIPTATTAVAAPTTTVVMTDGNAVAPVINGYLSAILAGGTLSTDTVTVLKKAVDTFASSYSSGTNAAGDKVAAVNLITSLNSLAAGLWSKAITSGTTTASATTAATATTNTATLAAPPTTSVATTVAPTAVLTPTAINAATTTPASTATGTTAASSVVSGSTATTVSSASTTAADITSPAALKSLLFTAIRAPGV